MNPNPEYTEDSQMPAEWASVKLKLKGIVSDRARMGKAIEVASQRLRIMRYSLGRRDAILDRLIADLQDSIGESIEAVGSGGAEPTAVTALPDALTDILSGVSRDGYNIRTGCHYCGSAQATPHHRHDCPLGELESFLTRVTGSTPEWLQTDDELATGIQI